MVLPMTAAPVIAQNADVRFLGKLLGDVIRPYGGAALLDRIEAIRAASVDRFRGVPNPRGLAAGWESLSLDETVAFVRSFMLFSMLANLAEDRQGAVAEKESTLAAALRYLGTQGTPPSAAAAMPALMKAWRAKPSRRPSVHRSRCCGRPGRCGANVSMWRTKSIRRSRT